MIVMYRSRHNIINDITDNEIRDELLKVLGNNSGVWIVENDEVIYTNITGIIPNLYEINEKVSFLLIMPSFIRVYYRDVYNPIAQLTLNPIKTCLDMGILK